MELKILQNRYLEDTETYVRNYFEKDASGHDWWHIFRVRNLALKIAEKEGGDKFIIEMAALLHDLDDWKLNGDANEAKSKKWLQQLEVAAPDAEKILEIIEQVSYKGAGVENTAFCLEAKIVQDADRLDAIGAIGVARTFAYGGSKQRLIYDPIVKPVLHDDFESYKKNTAPTINHFYEKLLLLKNRLNTKAAIELAISRHRFLEEFLAQFFNEWDGKK